MRQAKFVADDILKFHGRRFTWNVKDLFPRKTQTEKSVAVATGSFKGYSSLNRTFTWNVNLFSVEN